LNIFFSGGSDKYLYAWDVDKKKKIYKSSQYESAITACSLNSDGSLLAIASSENNEDLNFSVQGQSHLNKHKIFIKSINY
jgi:WD40 repeat protein